MKLFPREYGKLLKNQSVCIAVQSDSLLKDWCDKILKDIKFLQRFDIFVVLLHAFSDIKEIENKFCNQAKVISLYGKYGSDFDQESLKFAEVNKCKKLIFVERQPAKNKEGCVIDTITLKDYKLLDQILPSSIEVLRYQKILDTIKEGHFLKDVHVISGNQPKAIQKELFSIEGVGTLITNDIKTIFLPCTDQDVHPLLNLLKSYEKKGSILPRNIDYIERNIENFSKVTIDGILAGCVEKIHLCNDIVELGALVSVGRFLKHGVGRTLLPSIFSILKKDGYKKNLVVTKNKKFSDNLIRYYKFKEIKLSDSLLDDKIKDRLQRSPYARFFISDI